MPRPNPKRAEVIVVMALAIVSLPLRGFAETPPLKPLLERAMRAASAGDAVGLKSLLTSEFAATLTPAAIAAVRAQVFAPRGRVQSVSVVSQERDIRGDITAKFVVQMTKGNVEGTVMETKAGRIAGLTVRPALNRARYVTRAEVALPFAGTWYALWGGTDPAKNRHASDPAQKYAYDFVVQKEGRTHTGDGTKNTDYYAYGQPVLSPVAGTVVMAVDGLPDNTPGRTDPYMAFGNCVLIAAGQGEYAVLAHLRPGSLKVKPGDTVTLGQPLGLCGSSGNSSEPHLHFHMQTSRRLGDGDGLPITFRRFVQDGTPLAAGIAAGQVRLENQQP